jgi:dihydroflavonol-4-reductase
MTQAITNEADKRNILVTGSAGLVGKELVNQLLEKNFSVIALYNKTPLQNIQNKNLSVLQCDLLDTSALEDALQGITEVYHCAGLVSFSPGKRNDLFKLNVEATANIVNASLNAGVKKIVHVSSVAALGKKRKEELINEKMYWTPETGNSLYAQSKYLGEMEVWRGVAEGLQAVVVNPSVILGDGDWNSGSTALFKKVHSGLKWYSEGVTGFVGLKDVCKAMILLMESDIYSERFILSADNKSYKDILFNIADGFKLPRPNKKVTPLLAGLLWRLENIKSKLTGKDPLITKETAAAALDKAYFDNGKLLKFLPDFRYEALSDTIAQTCNKLMNQNH